MKLSRMRRLIPRISSKAMLPPVGAAKRLNYQLYSIYKYTNHTVAILRQKRPSVISVIPSQRTIVALILFACVLQISLPFAPNHFLAARDISGSSSPLHEKNASLAFSVLSLIGISINSTKDIGTIYASNSISWNLKKAVCLGLFYLFMATVHLQLTMRERLLQIAPHQPTRTLILLKLPPLKALSRINGALFRMTVPKCLRRPLFGVATRLLGINMTEARTSNLEHYKSYLQLFTRRVKEELRPVDTDHSLVSPADGVVIQCGPVRGNLVQQVKGVNYSLRAFLGPGTVPRLPQSAAHWPSERVLYNAVVYLSPKEYHHFHSPVKWTAQLRRHFPGDLMSVNSWAVQNVPGIYTLNERVALTGYWEHGFFSMTAVGAFNVGSIFLDMDESLQTNTDSSYQSNSFHDKSLLTEGNGILLEKGSHVGGFNLGSTMVLLFEGPSDFKFTASPGDRVLYGEALGHALNP